MVASKVVSIAEGRFVDLADVRPGPAALGLSARTGKPAEIVELILGESSESSEHFGAGERGPIIARHHLGHQLTSAGIDRAGANGAWLLPRDPDASARALRDAITAWTRRPRRRTARYRLRAQRRRSGRDAPQGALTRPALRCPGRSQLRARPRRAGLRCTPPKR
ncbi:coenzyme F420-0:L-glutamate ligase [Streptomyces sp. NPDC101393]|uniref:coenzyme F420-0:L-glutamate ligase n=1 Tax=Streptomyces sp. NPDC101393 TaxID=3366141 RepID=UPI0038129003